MLKTIKNIKAIVVILCMDPREHNSSQNVKGKIKNIAIEGFGVEKENDVLENIFFITAMGGSKAFSKYDTLKGNIDWGAIEKSAYQHIKVIMQKYDLHEVIFFLVDHENCHAWSDETTIRICSPSLKEAREVISGKLNIPQKNIILLFDQMTGDKKRSRKTIKIK